VDLAFVERVLARTETDEAGRFEFDEAVPEGAELRFEMPAGFELDSAVRELDGVPREELVFVARAVPTDVVRGEVVDELTGERVPYLRFSLGDEKVESDAHGAFVTRERYSRGVLQVSVMNWPFEMSWDPERDAQVLVPARVGPAFFLRLDRQCEGLGRQWIPDGNEPRGAIALDGGVPFELQCPPDLVRFASVPQGKPVRGLLVLHDVQAFSCAWAALAPGRGTEAEPVRLAFQPCGYLALEVHASRELAWQESLTLSLSPRAANDRGEAWKAVLVGRAGMREADFLILHPGECWLEAAFDGESIGRWPVTTRLGEVVMLPLSLDVPGGKSAQGEAVTKVHLSGSVSGAHRPSPGDLRLTRADGEEALIELEWKRERGRWIGTLAGEAPAGEYRAKLELDTPFRYSGPATIRVPSTDELLYTLEDSAPPADVYLVPRGAESGAPLLSYEVELTTPDGRLFDSDDIHVPGVPIARDFPRDAPFCWMCIAPGRHAACGRWDPDGGDGDIRIEFDLERGWGKFLSVVGPDYEALEGVAVFLDGVSAGSTRTDGRLCLVAKVRPQLITLRYRDWRIDDGMVEGDGSFDDSQTELNVYLTPPK